MDHHAHAAAAHAAGLDPSSLGHIDALSVQVPDYMHGTHSVQDDYISSMGPGNDFLEKSYKRKRHPDDHAINSNNKIDSNSLAPPNPKFIISSAPPSPSQNDTKYIDANRRNSSAEGLLPRNNNNGRAGPVPASSEPLTEVIDGVEWVSFIYSHNRQLKQYKIRTDIDNISLENLSDQFKNENCIYPRAFTTQEQYQGNRWKYETECNQLGWKLAALNSSEIAGKRGLIQRAVDSYRNRYPDMRSRRVTRQEKLLKGTLRKRKLSRALDLTGFGGANNNKNSSLLDTKDGNDDDLNNRRPSLTYKPKTLNLDDVTPGRPKLRIKINIEEIKLDDIDVSFKQHNCVFPRANVPNDQSYTGHNYEIEKKCNELGWKLAWLNPKAFQNNPVLLQRAVDAYRAKYTEDLKPRKGRNRTASSKSNDSLHNQHQSHQSHQQHQSQSQQSQQHNSHPPLPHQQQQQHPQMQPTGNNNLLSSHPMPPMHPQQHLMPGQFISNVGGSMYPPHPPHIYEQFLRLRPPPPVVAGQQSGVNTNSINTTSSHYTHLPPMQPGQSSTQNGTSSNTAQININSVGMQNNVHNGLPPLVSTNNTLGGGFMPTGIATGMTYNNIHPHHPQQQQQQFYYQYTNSAPTQFQQNQQNQQMQFMHTPSAATATASDGQQQSWGPDFHL